MRVGYFWKHLLLRAQVSTVKSRGSSDLDWEQHFWLSAFSRFGCGCFFLVRCLFGELPDADANEHTRGTAALVKVQNIFKPSHAIVTTLFFYYDVLLESYAVVWWRRSSFLPVFRVSKMWEKLCMAHAFPKQLDPMGWTRRMHVLDLVSGLRLLVFFACTHTSQSLLPQT